MPALTLALSALLHLYPAVACGVPAGAAVETAPKPRPVPGLKVPETWGPRVVPPPRKREE